MREQAKTKSPQWSLAQCATPVGEARVGKYRVFLLKLWAEFSACDFEGVDLRVWAENAKAIRLWVDKANACELDIESVKALDGSVVK